jgi:glycosyltransferase involved in cell wall biosynthesis
MASSACRDILQNQDSFAAPQYRARVSPLVEVIRQRSRLAPTLWAELRKWPLLSGLLLFRHAMGFRAVVTVGHRAALVFGVLRRLLGRRQVLHVAKEFYFEEKAEVPAPGWRGLLQRLRLRAYRWALADVDALVVNAQGERPAYARLFHLSPAQVVFLPWPSNIEPCPRLHEDDGTILAAGRSLRDWRTFLQAVDGLPYRFVMVASRRDLAGLHVPGNVSLFADVPRAAYLQLLRRARFAVVPLRPSGRSTGQATFLECLALGKPVVVTETVGSVDYIEHDENGLLCPPADPAALRRQIIRLAEDPALRKRLAEGGLRSIRERFNKSAYARALLAVIDQLLRQRSQGVPSQLRPAASNTGPSMQTRR